VFDLAGTLFWSADFDHAAHTNAVRCLASTFNVSYSEALEMLEMRRNEMSSRSLFTVALSTAMSTFGIDADLWDEYQTDVDLNATLAPDPAVAKLVSRLHGRYRLVLYTNICRPLVTRVLEHLDLAGIWNQVITPRDAGEPKPAAGFPQSLLSRLQIQAQHVLAIGDRLDIDLLPFTTLGAGGYLVSDRDDLVRLLLDLGRDEEPISGLGTIAHEQTPRTPLP
jgi:FMN phosphatase YigB (HAD superfamily)